MKRYLALSVILWAQPIWAGSNGDFSSLHTKAGDVLQVGIPLFGLGLTFLLLPDEARESVGLGWDSTRLNSDWNTMNGSPRHDFAVAFARAETFTYGLKYSVDAQRPNGGGQSFPSGHTAMAFMGAEFIRKEYGWWWGVPAYLAAGYVGWTRVASGNHWTQDVLGGAAIGLLSNHDFSEIRTPAGQLSIGMALIPDGSLSTAFDAPDPMASAFSDPEPADFAPGVRFELRF